MEIQDHSLEWAALIIKKYSGLPTIVSTHEHLQATGKAESNIAMEVSKVDLEDNNPQMVWEKFFNSYTSRWRRR